VSRARCSLPAGMVSHRANSLSHGPLPRVNLELLIQTAKKSLSYLVLERVGGLCAKQLASSGLRLLEGQLGMGHGHSWGKR
jgi:hypothetical protein